jgi:RNA polymerase sigma factor (sigma-70 family)
MADRPVTRPRSTPSSGLLSRQSGSLGLADWVREYAVDLQRFLSKRRIVESDIHDICQEVYLRLLRFDRAEIIQNPQAYLFRVAANVAHDFNLRKRQWTALETEQLDELAIAPDSALLADEAHRGRVLAAVLAQLPPLPRAALALLAQEDLTYEEIAVRLGVSRRVVKRAVARGYALARESLAQGKNP